MVTKQQEAETLESSLRKIEAYLCDPRFRHAFDKEDKGSLSLVIRDLATTPEDEPDINRELRQVAKAIGVVGYLRAKYEGLRDAAVEEEKLVEAAADPRARKSLIDDPNVGKPTEKMVASKVLEDQEFKAARQVSQNATDVFRQIFQLFGALATRHRSLEQVSNNLRKDLDEI